MKENQGYPPTNAWRQRKQIPPVSNFKMFHLCFYLLLHSNHGASYYPLEIQGISASVADYWDTVVIMLYNLILD